MSADPAYGQPDDEPTAALFERRGERLVPTTCARGPWSPDALHGGPVAALATRDAERHGTDELRLARITLELLRPVPLVPLGVRSAVVRPGRRVQLVDTVVEAGGTEVAWCRSLFVRSEPGRPAAEPTVPEDPPPDPPGRGRPLAPAADRYPAFHNRAVEMRFVAGAFDGPGPATVWIRLVTAVVAGEQPTPWQRVAAVSDFGNGISSELPFGTDSVFINPDLTVSVRRPPVGAWVCLDARTRFGSPGMGAAESALWDERGRIGRAVQSLVVEVGTHG